MKKQLKIAAFAALLTLGFTANAQQTSGNITKEAEALPGSGATGSIRVIDNKGTIKYLNATNGITMLTNDANGKTTTTWQLGGELKSNTTIDMGTFEFKLDGAQFLLDKTVAIDPTTGNPEDTAATTATAGTSGYMFLVRDEATGQVKKLLLSDLIQESRSEVSANSTQEGDNEVIATLAFVADQNHVKVYRNGAKLIAGTDYTVSGTTLTIKPSTTTGVQSWEVYEGDFFEYHYTK